MPKTTSKRRTASKAASSSSDVTGTKLAAAGVVHMAAGKTSDQTTSQSPQTTDSVRETTMTVGEVSQTASHSPQRMDSSGRETSKAMSISIVEDLFGDAGNGSVFKVRHKRVPMETEQRTVYARRQRLTILTSVTLLITSIIEFAIGLHLFFMVINYRLPTVGAFWSSSGAILGVSISLFGMYFNENYNSCIKWGARFVILSILMCICGAIIDGIAAVKVGDVDLDRCMYSADTINVECERKILFTTVTCETYVEANTCYCCYRILDFCQESANFRPSLMDVPGRIAGVSSCDDVVMYVWLLRTSFGFCFLNIILGVCTQVRLMLFYQTVRSQHDMTIVVPQNSYIYVSPPLQKSMSSQQATDPNTGQQQPCPCQGQQELNPDQDQKEDSPATSDESNPSTSVHESTATTV